MQGNRNFLKNVFLTRNKATINEVVSAGAEGRIVGSKEIH